MGMAHDSLSYGRIHLLNRDFCTFGVSDCPLILNWMSKRINARGGCAVAQMAYFGRFYWRRRVWCVLCGNVRLAVTSSAMRLMRFGACRR